jgi:Skp family chaperone for outer membrane proteins
VRRLSGRRRTKNKLNLITELSEKQTLLTDLKTAFKEQQAELQAAKKELQALHKAAAS